MLDIHAQPTLSILLAGKFEVAKTRESELTEVSPIPLELTASKARWYIAGTVASAKAYSIKYSNQILTRSNSPITELNVAEGVLFGMGAGTGLGVELQGSRPSS
jgi:hypothetical protein